MIKKQNRRYNAHKKTTAQRLMPIAKILSILIILGFTIWGVVKIKEMDFLQTKITWQIDNNLLVAQSHLESKVQPLIKNKYLLLNLIEIKQVLENEPWIATANIKRLFFNSIQVSIKTHKIAMRWENINCKQKSVPGCLGYISTNGTLFMPRKTVKSNAVLAHSKAEQAVITQLYQDYQNYQKSSGEMRIHAFSKTQIDTLIFKPNIKVILGYQQKQQRLERFLKAYKELKKTTPKVKLNRASFDMRYPKGFSLKL
ncbi:cell division protein FtsQ/DivIB [Bathymodiolus septemdierum thioautotrophic gill symbiont]|uniref:Cell division protein FtsQ n=1 Tax=endosymbiont of Bathymodiolus septemdierum str. Myojin knoll TaxID=1303921 RepID=A0A0P0USD7_9GAMM|nr:cell division protein FtsQ/DivIB [Bathymodiolus septemdierum thioautotrophic gill symbiont]BAS68102.1 cell division protein FtsQ [endosymbiont of Bathymodiolus septemdierum str. Myojin knoll]